MTDDRELLRRYAEEGSEPAFGELVGRYLDLVYSAAARQVGGDTHLAQDVAQTVFTALARKARVLPQDVVLGGWLYRATRLAAAQCVRANSRRRQREQAAAQMTTPDEPTEPVWEQLVPFLDEALHGLGRHEREALVLRFFERRELRSVGEALGTTEDAARMRVTRALEKLRGHFKRRGLTLSAATLATLLAGKAVTAAPPGLLGQITAAALNSLPAATGGLAGLLKLFTMTKLQLASGALAVAGLTTALVVQHRTLARTQEENDTLQSQLRQRTAAEAVAKPGAPVIDPDEVARLRAEHADLLRLRGEVGTLKRALAAARQSLPAASSAAPQAPAADPEEIKTLAIAKLNYTKGWVLAFMMYAGDHQNQYPTNFDQAAAYLPAGASALTNLGPDQFEMVYQGTVGQMTNSPGPAATIVLREKAVWPGGANGGWNRAYAFGDGHSEIHHTDDGDFGPWEAQHLARPVGP